MSQSFSGKTFFALVKTTYILTILVILAGSVVRTTNSGMGCPDWPKCYGYFIPPDNADQLEYLPERKYEKGHMVILHDTLWRARKSFTSGAIFAREDWEKYPKHNYARFNVYETWIEYINRLLGALLGLSVIAMFVSSIFTPGKNKKTVIFCFLLLVLTGIQGWLGSLVVASNLSPVKITLHMLIALLILGFVQFILFIARRDTLLNPAGTLLTNRDKKLSVTLIIFIGIQVILGTQVRENIDQINTLNQNLPRDLWISNLPIIFPIHRSFSILILLLATYYLVSLHKSAHLPSYRWAKTGVLLIASEIISGIVLNYFGFPAIIQPLHLLLAMLIFSSFLESRLSMEN